MTIFIMLTVKRRKNIVKPQREDLMLLVAQIPIMTQLRNFHSFESISFYFNQDGVNFSNYKRLLN